MSLSFSIIIPHLNRRHMLREALASVHAQRWPSVEIIVVDGGSTDGSVEELAERTDIRLLTGPDRGVFDAFNKGIAAASGEVIGILNSDDLYADGAFAAIDTALSSHPDAHAACGTAILTEDGQTIETYGRSADKTLTPRTVMIGSCVPNARFFRRKAVARVGPFSPDYTYVADRDWLARWYEAGFATVPLDQHVYTYRRHPGSLTFDAERSHERRIRRELLDLARWWMANDGASQEMRHAARLLEGRCVLWLAAAALRQMQFGQATRHLLKARDRWSLGPILSAVESAIDREMHRRDAPARDR